jgi:hypothetical protein
MTNLKFIAYTDIHHDRFAAHCIKLKDTLDIEHQVFQRAFEGSFDFILFCGDRFLKRDPEDEVKTKADRLLLENLHYASVEHPNFQHYRLIGNHDWVNSSLKWHTSESLKGLTNLWIFDGSYYTVNHSDYCIHGLPADFNFDINLFQPDSSKFNIFMFHDIVKGSYSDEGGNHTFPDGVSISDIDRPEFNLVLAGDIHVPQRLNFKNTTGGYIGSVLQRTRADANRPRGWLEIEATKTSDSWDISTVFVPVRNFFTRITFDVGANTRFEDLSIPEEYFHDQSVEVTLRGSKIDVDRVSESERWKNYVTFESARGIDVVRGYEVAQSEVAVDMTQSTSLVDDLEAYLDSGFVDIGNLDREVLISEIAHV